MVDATAELAEPAAVAAPALADDLRGDGDGGLLRRTGSKIKSDRAGESSDLDLGEPCFAQPLETFLMGLPRPHRADIAELREAKRNLQDRYVELRIVGEYANHGAGVDPARVDLRCQVAMRPVDDHFVRIGKPGTGREHRSRIADGHPVSQEAAEPGNCGREIDSAENQHPRMRRIAGREDAHPFPAALTFRAIREELGLACRQQAADIVGNSCVSPLAAE